MAQRRSVLAKVVADLCGEQLTLEDPRDGWPALARVLTSNGTQEVALHVGPIGLSHRGRDDVERRFQNPGGGRPERAPGERVPLLLGLWDEVTRPVLAGMDAERRLGSTSRHSLFIPLDTLRQAAENGWAEHYSASDELIIAFHPTLIGTYTEVRKGTHSISAEQMIRLLQATGLAEEDTEGARKRARTAASRLVRDTAFGRNVVEAYDGLCAMCGFDFGLIHGAHIYPVAAPGSPDEIWNGLALCGNHHAAFDKHLIWVEPAARELRLHPDLRRLASTNKTCRQFVEVTGSALRDPSSSEHVPDPEMFDRRYRFFADSYEWAA